jgi:hypothetical protein
MVDVRRTVARQRFGVGSEVLVEFGGESVPEPVAINAARDSEPGESGIPHPDAHA